MTTQYSAKDAVVQVDGTRIKGLASGTFVSVSRNNDRYSQTADAYGEDVTQETNLDDTGTMELTVKQDSPSLNKLEELSKSGKQVTARVVDKSSSQGSNPGRRCKDCKVEVPDFSRADTTEEITVTLKAAQVKVL